MTDHRVIASISILASLGFFSAPTIWAAPACGDIITTNTTLDADVGPCATDPALTVEGPATLDLNGFTVSCSTTSTFGIVLTEKSAKLLNGVVRNCNFGVILAGVGSHRVEQVLSTDNSNTGFYVDSGSDKNELDGNAATGNGGVGFGIAGANAKLINNTSTGNEVGFFNFNTNDGQLQHNTAAANNEWGFGLDGNGIKVDKNVAQQNGGEGFAIGGSNSTVTSNQAFDNGREGINNFAIDSKFLKNTALGNGSDDIVEENADCDNNQWKNNVFGSANRACVE